MADQIPESTKLLPCPFCGADAQIEHGSDHHGAWFNLGCSRHWGSGLADADDGCIGGRIYYTETETPEAEAIAAWNTRAAPPAMDREAVARIIDPTSFCDVPYTDDPIMIDMVKTWQDTALAKADAILSTLSADAIRQGEGFIRMVSRLTHSGDDGWTPDDADDATQTLDGLIAKARTTISGHMVDCAWHVDQYPHECTCALATPASHASDGGKA